MVRTSTRLFEVFVTFFIEVKNVSYGELLRDHLQKILLASILLRLQLF
jgi:hypothetical protein